ncbi:MAG TPA: hypothetical protein VMZ31_19995 [Phycisphaerae bacterium]|nr:hypothetical protein [Phycisphaerae bacterium]
MSNGEESHEHPDSNSNLPAPKFKTAATIIKETSGAIKEVSIVYERVGLAGTLTASGIVVTIFTIVLAFFSGTMTGDQWRTGITLQEEILFGCMSIALGAAWLSVATRRRA